MDKKLKEKLTTLLIYVAIGVVGARVTGYFLYQNRMEFWKAQAHDAFYEALKVEMQKRSGIEVYYATSGNVSLAEEMKEPKTVTMGSGYGKRDYIIPYYKYCHNIDSRSEQQDLHSYFFE